MLYHVVNEFEPDNASTVRRNAVAKGTWDWHYNNSNVFVPCYFYIDEKTRTSDRVFKGEKRRLPYLKDLLDWGVSHCKNLDDGVVYTNADNCLALNALSEIEKALSKAGACWSQRWDYKRVEADPENRPAKNALMANARPYAGFDLFAFYKGWWIKKRDCVADMLIGSQAWDSMLSSLINWSGGVGIIPPVVYHEDHSKPWAKVGYDSQAEVHNLVTFREWLIKMNKYHLVIERYPYLLSVFQKLRDKGIKLKDSEEVFGMVSV